MREEGWWCGEVWILLTPTRLESLRCFDPTYAPVRVKYIETS